MNRLISRAAIVATTLVSWMAGGGELPGQERGLKGSNANSRQAVQGAIAMLPQNHLSQRQADDDLSRRWLKAFLDSADGQRFYFLQSDINQFNTRKDELDDQARQGQVGFAYEVFKTYLSRVEQRVQMAKELLGSPLDFSVNESLSLDRANGSWPNDESEARELARKNVKYQVLKKMAAGSSEEEARASLVRHYDGYLSQMRQYNDEELLELYLSALGNAYDPHTTYMSQRTVQNFEITNRQQLDGIGAQLQLREGEVFVVRVPAGGPVAKDGRIKAGDRISGVGQGENGAIADVGGKRLNEVVDLIRGKGGTVVRLQVIPKGQSEKVIYHVVRGKVQAEAAKGLTVQHGQKGDGKPYRFGVIRLPSLYSSKFQGGTAPEVKTSTSDVRRLLTDPQRGFKPAGVDAVILDLRSNTGGVLTEAVNLPGLFLGAGATVQVKGTDGMLNAYNSDEQSAWDGPLIVLTNRQTASGAEIVAAAIQDCGRGLLIGDSGTTGNGTVQSILEVKPTGVQGANAPRLGMMKITKEQFYRVSGDSTQNRGIQPDVVLPSLTDDPEWSEAYRANALPFDTVEAVNHPAFGLVRPEIVQQLSQQSVARREQSAEYQQLEADLAQLQEIRLQKSVSLLGETGREQILLKTRSQEEVVPETAFDDNFQNREILEIAADYVRMLKK